MQHQQQRHRSPGSGYRSRISPEYRYFNRTGPRSGGSFQPHPPPPPPPAPPPPQPRKADIFVEAGRLAAEYLVSQGFLPPALLSSNPKWHAKRFSARPTSDPSDAALLHIGGGPEGGSRTSALARLGSAVADANADSDASRRRFGDDEFNSPLHVFRTHNLKSSRRRLASSSSSLSYRGYGGGRDYEYPRSASFHDRLSRDANAADDHNTSLVSEQQPIGNDVCEGLQDSAEPRDLDSSTAWKDSSEEPDNKTQDYDSASLDARAGKPREDCTPSIVDETEKLEKAPSEGGSSSNPPDLRTTLTMCKFAKVPTKTRSSKVPKIPKLDPILPPSEPEKKPSAISSQGEMEVLAAQNSLACEDDRESSLGPCSSVAVKERGDKRALEVGCDTQEGAAKRPRDWPPSAVAMDAGDYLDPHCVSERKVSLHEDGAPSVDNRGIMAVGHENLLVNKKSQFLKDEGEASVEFSQEKQLFPGSFKICDLNLMEVSEAHENRHDSDPVVIYPALSDVKREAAPVDIDLSISNSNALGESSRRPVESKEIEVIDLENDSSPEDKDLVLSDKKTETVYSELEGFPSHVQNSSDIPDVQDGYGLMISELLENDFPNCSSVPEHINPIHSDISLHNGEGALGDDDSIYMSLGEIPLTYLRPWEQPPPQEYEKPF